MGTIITFPESRRYSECAGMVRNEPATIIILPVIRIERFGDDPTDGFDGPPAPGCKRRPRNSRS
jgi:hypothetical protein